MSQSGQDFGANDWLVEEMYERYQSDPSSVPSEWIAHFQNNAQVTDKPKAGTPPTPKPVTPPNISVQGSVQPTPAAPVAAPVVTQPRRRHLDSQGAQRPRAADRLFRQPLDAGLLHGRRPGL